MPVLSDKWIKKNALTKGMIKPFVSKQVRKGKISFGLSSYGYDARVSNEFKIFTNVNSGIVDPKVFKKESFVTKIGKEYEVEFVKIDTSGSVSDIVQQYTSEIEKTIIKNPEQYFWFHKRWKSVREYI